MRQYVIRSWPVSAESIFTAQPQCQSNLVKLLLTTANPAYREKDHQGISLETLPRSFRRLVAVLPRLWRSLEVYYLNSLGTDPNSSDELSRHSLHCLR